MPIGSEKEILHSCDLMVRNLPTYPSLPPLLDPPGHGAEGEARGRGGHQRKTAAGDQERECRRPRRAFRQLAPRRPCSSAALALRAARLSLAGRRGPLTWALVAPSCLQAPHPRAFRPLFLQGKFNIGYKATLKSLRGGKAQLIVVADNTPPLRKSEIEYYAMLAKTTGA